MATAHVSERLHELTPLFQDRAYGWTKEVADLWVAHEHGTVAAPRLLEMSARLKQDGIGNTKEFATLIVEHLQMCVVTCH